MLKRIKKQPRAIREKFVVWAATIATALIAIVYLSLKFGLSEKNTIVHASAVEQQVETKSPFRIFAKTFTEDITIQKLTKKLKDQKKTIQETKESIASHKPPATYKQSKNGEVTLQGQ